MVGSTEAQEVKARERARADKKSIIGRDGKWYQYKEADNQGIDIVIEVMTILAGTAYMD